VLHAPGLGGGALLSGDIITVVQDRRWVSFMRSYPNLVPLARAAVQRIVARLSDAQFENMYGGWWDADADAVVVGDGRMVVERSAVRYVAELDSQDDR
jgi:hypothetical protein